MQPAANFLVSALHVRPLEALLIAVECSRLRWQTVSLEYLSHIVAALQVILEGGRLHLLPLWIGHVLLTSSFHFQRAHLIIASISGLLIFITLIWMQLVPLFRFPKAMGPSYVGVKDMYWTDEKDGRLRGMKIWYPAKRGKTSSLRNSLLGPHARKNLTYFFGNMNMAAASYVTSHLSLIKTAAVMDAEIDVSARAGSSSLSLPLVIFSPGLHGLPEIYSHYCESLASYGYIVASVRHTDGSVTSLGPKGEVLYDYVPLKNVPNLPEESFRRSQLMTRVGDVKSCLSHLLSMKEALRIDQNNIFISGHSFGGATSVAVLMEVPIFKAAISLDTWVMPIPHYSLERVKALAKPLIFIISENWHKPESVERIRSYCNASGGYWKLFRLRYSTHYSFSDVPMWLTQRLAYLARLSTPNLPYTKGMRCVVQRSLYRSVPISFAPLILLSTLRRAQHRISTCLNL